MNELKYKLKLSVSVRHEVSESLSDFIIGKNAAANGLLFKARNILIEIDDGVYGADATVRKIITNGLMAVMSVISAFRFFAYNNGVGVATHHCSEVTAGRCNRRIDE